MYICYIYIIYIYMYICYIYNIYIYIYIYLYIYKGIHSLNTLAIFVGDSACMYFD